MNEITFNYNIDELDSKTEIKAKYLWRKAYNYAFSFYRGIYLLDTSVFNSPVAAERVATGIFNIKSLFEQASARDLLLNKYPMFFADKSFDLSKYNDGKAILAMKIKVGDLCLYPNYFGKLFKNMVLFDDKNYAGKPYNNLNFWNKRDLFYNNSKNLDIWDKKDRFLSKSETLNKYNHNIFGSHDKTFEWMQRRPVFGMLFNKINGYIVYGNCYKTISAKTVKNSRESFNYQIFGKRYNNMDILSLGQLAFKKPKNALLNKIFSGNRKYYDMTVKNIFSGYRKNYSLSIRQWSFKNAKLKHIYKLNILSPYMSGEMSHNFRIFDSFHFKTGFSKTGQGLNVFQDLFFKKETLAEYYENIFIKKKYKRIFTAPTISVYKKYRKVSRFAVYNGIGKADNINSITADKLKIYLGRKINIKWGLYKNFYAKLVHYPITVNKDKTVSGPKKNKNSITIYNNYFGQRPENYFYGSVFKTYSGKTPDNILNKNKEVLLWKKQYSVMTEWYPITPHKKTYISADNGTPRFLYKKQYESLLNASSYAWKQRKRIFSIKQPSLLKSKKSVLMHKDNVSLFKISKTAYVFKRNPAYRASKHAFEQYFEDHLYGYSSENRFVTIYKNITIKRADFKAFIAPSLWGYVNDRNVSIFQEQSPFYVEQRRMDIMRQHMFKISKRKIQIFNHLYSSVKESGKLISPQYQLHPYRDAYKLSNAWFMDKRWFFGAVKESHSMRIKDDLVALVKTPHSMRIKDDLVDAVKKSYLMRIKDDTASGIRYKYKFFYANNLLWFNKEQKKLSIEYYNLWINKQLKYASIPQNPVFFQKQIKTAWYFNPLSRGKKTNKYFFIDRHDEWFVKQEKNSDYYNHVFWFVKSLKRAWTERMQRGIKGILPLDYHWTLAKEFGGFAFSISKNKKYAYIDGINEWAKKLFLNTDYIQSGIWFNMLPKNVFMNYYDIWVKKGKIPAWYDDYVSWASKLKLRTAIHDGMPWAKLLPKPTMIDLGEIWAKLLPKPTMIDRNNEWAKTLPKRAFLTDQVFGRKMPQKVNYFHGVSCFKFIQFGWYDYELFGKKLPSITNENKTIFGKKEDQLVDFYDLVPDIVREELNAYYDAYVVSAKDFDNIILKFKEESAAPLKHNPLEYMPEKDTWAWVYEDPDPFEGEYYGIDELLLPEQEIPYEEFENLVFDKKTLQPVNPVKQLSSQKFVAKFPIKTPINDGRETEGIIYPIGPFKKMTHGSSGDEHQGRWVYPDQGVKTWLLHDVFLGYYRIWQKNLYKFASLDCVKSANLMLDYLWVSNLTLWVCVMR